MLLKMEKIYSLCEILTCAYNCFATFMEKRRNKVKPAKACFVSKSWKYHIILTSYLSTLFKHTRHNNHIFTYLKKTTAMQLFGF